MDNELVFFTKKYTKKLGSTFRHRMGLIELESAAEKNTQKLFDSYLVNALNSFKNTTDKEELKEVSKVIQSMLNDSSNFKTEKQAIDEYYVEDAIESVQNIEFLILRSDFFVVNMNKTLEALTTLVYGSNKGVRRLRISQILFRSLALSSTNLVDSVFRQKLIDELLEMIELLEKSSYEEGFRFEDETSNKRFLKILEDCRNTLTQLETLNLFEAH